MTREEREFARVVAAKLTGKMIVPVAVGRMDATGKVFIPALIQDVEGVVEDSHGATWLMVPDTILTAGTQTTGTVSITARAVFYNDRWFAKALRHPIVLGYNDYIRVVSDPLILNFGDPNG